MGSHQLTPPGSDDTGNRIEDYALIGDCRTAALVGIDGSIDWLCWPRFDSPACFAALLGTTENGRWRIAPAAPTTRATRRYLGDTMVLETLFQTSTGSIAVIDFMAHDGGSLIRIVEGRTGRVDVEMELELRFEYGSAVPWVTHLPSGSAGIRAVAGPDQVALRTTIPLFGRGLSTVGQFTVVPGDRIGFTLTHAASHDPLPAAPDIDAELRATLKFWSNWAERCTYRGRWAPAVRRSLLTLKALSHRVTGGIVAAPTTSLPEQLGGARNWDYRYCWPRDAAFTLQALLNAGYRDEAQAWSAWLRRAVAGAPDQLRTLYGLGGERWLPEHTLPWLSGHRGSVPVRVGNAASTQLQLDVFGELLHALYTECAVGLADPASGWGLQTALIEHLETLWERPDEGIWEVRGGTRHFTLSKAMCWVAFDRAIRTAETWSLPAPLDRWRALRNRIHTLVCERGYNAERGSFTQIFDGDTLDASLLLLPQIGFLPADDPRMTATIEAIGADLMLDGRIRRYRTEETNDGLQGREGAFLACSFWYVDALTLLGRHAQAEAFFTHLLGLCNDVGLLAEEYDPVAQRMLGNFPQAFSHLALINAATRLGS